MSRRSISIGITRFGLCAGFLIAVTAAGASAQSARTPTSTLILGEITSLAVDNMRDPASGGRLVVDGKTIIVPEKLSIGLATGKSSLQGLMVAASEDCKTQDPPQSGLATSDSCRGQQPPALARIKASPNANGELVATLLMIQKNSGRALARMKPDANASKQSYGRTPRGYSRKQPK